MRARQPPPRLDRIDANPITRFIATEYTFRGKATVNGLLSMMRNKEEVEN
jgi:hypothetical protein